MENSLAFKGVNGGALSGMRVYDASQGIAGPHATMLLALNGADVIKVEPGSGDWCRTLGKAVGQETTSFLAFNRGKRSLACDLKSAAGMAISRKLMSTCDIVVESFRPGVAAKLGIGYEQVREHNPTVIYTSVSGFGQSGPLAMRPAVDGVIQAYSGMMEMNRFGPGQPHRIGMVAVDVVTGLYAYQATVAAVIRRLRFGEGAYLDVNMAQSAAAFQATKVMEYWESGGSPEPLYAPAGVFATSDGSVYVSGMRAEHFGALCGVLGRPDLAADPRWQTQGARARHADAIHAELRKEFVKRSTAEWLQMLHPAGVLAETVCSYGEWLKQEHSLHTRAFSWAGSQEFGQLPVPRVPGIMPVEDDPASCSSAPLIGEHSRAILEELGFDAAWVDAQVATGSVKASLR